MREALVEGVPPSEVWITHQDEAVLRAVAVAVGHTALVAMADVAEAADEYLSAARYAWVAAKLGDEGRATKEVWVELMFRATDLLALMPEAQRGEDAVRAFEQEVLGAACLTELGSERNGKAVARAVELAAGAKTRLFETKMGEAGAHVVSGLSGVTLYVVAQIAFIS